VSELTPPVVATLIELNVRGGAFTVNTNPGEVTVPPVTVAVIVADPTAAALARPEELTVTFPFDEAQEMTALP
jgi:hypothetical protein